MQTLDAGRKSPYYTTHITSTSRHIASKSRITTPYETTYCTVQKPFSFFVVVQFRARRKNVFLASKTLFFFFVAVQAKNCVCFLQGRLLDNT